MKTTRIPEEPARDGCLHSAKHQAKHRYLNEDCGYLAVYAIYLVERNEQWLVAPRLAGDFSRKLSVPRVAPTERAGFRPNSRMMTGQ